MKRLYFRIVLLLTIGLSGCSDESTEITPELMIGGWNLDEVVINGLNGSEINDWISNSTALGLDSTLMYYRNYVTGNWSLEGDKLILDPADRLSGFYWEYEILTVTSKQLKMKIELTESQYCCDFEQFGDNELLTIVETYSRAEIAN
ncbi:MAG: hypothetical protein JXR10_04355 [Cyclobacteriaceae bacterium]